MDSWLCVGGGPSAGRVPDGHSFDMVATTNAGIRNWPNPDYYYLNDHVAIERYMAEAIEASQRGTCLVCMDKPSHTFGRKRLPFDSEHGEFVRGKYRYWPLSGIMVVELAVNMGATEIHLLGYEGYRDNERMVSKNEIQRQGLQSIIDAAPDVSFVFHSATEYTLTGPNVRSVVEV